MNTGCRSCSSSSRSSASRSSTSSSCWCCSRTSPCSADGRCRRSRSSTASAGISFAIADCFIGHIEDHAPRYPLRAVRRRAAATGRHPAASDRVRPARCAARQDGSGRDRVRVSRSRICRRALDAACASSSSPSSIVSGAVIFGAIVRARRVPHVLDDRQRRGRRTRSPTAATCSRRTRSTSSVRGCGACSRSSSRSASSTYFPGRLPARQARRARLPAAFQFASPLVAARVRDDHRVRSGATSVRHYRSTGS